MNIVEETRNFDLCSYIGVYNSTRATYVHWHENIELCYIINNPSRFLVDGSPIQAQPGDLVVIKEHAVHSFIADYDDTQIRIIQFPLRILLHLGAPIKPLKTHITAEDIARIPGLGESLDKFFEFMDKEDRVHNASDNLYMQFLAVTVYVLLMRYFSDESTLNISKKGQKRFLQDYEVYRREL